MFFHQGIFAFVEASGLFQNRVRNSNLTDVVEKRSDLQVLEFWFFEAKLLPHAHAPFRQASAVHSGIEIFQIQQLVKSADHRAAQGRKLLLDLLDAQRIQCPVKNRVHDEHRSWAGRHSDYQHNKRHEPDVELELFTHAEIA